MARSKGERRRDVGDVIDLNTLFFRKQRKIFIIKIFCFEKSLYYGTIICSGFTEYKATPSESNERGLRERAEKEKEP